MLAFKKYILPFQRESDALAFNIQPLDTLKYTNANFRQKANEAIDGAIIATGATARSTRPLAAVDILRRYMAIRSLNVSSLRDPLHDFLFQMGTPLGFYLLSGNGFVFLGIFDLETPREVVFRVKLLLQTIHQAKVSTEDRANNGHAPEQIEYEREIWRSIRIEVFVAPEANKSAIEARIKDMTAHLEQTEFSILNENDIHAIIRQEYDLIGEL